MRSVLLTIAGPNGAGKTTVTARLRAERWSHGVEYLNPDEIAQERFGDWNSADMAFETVFSAPDKVDFLRRAKAYGYFVRVFFIGTTDPRINAARVAGRVMQGGHTVPIEKIVERHGKSIANLSSALLLADRVYVYDNSVDDVEARLCARTIDGQLRKVYGPLPDWVADAIDGIPQHPEFVDLRAAS
jgi:predicted ABC-type ATPase